MLLHGFTSWAAGTWGSRGWIDLLVAGGFRVVAPDFRSHGASEPVHEPAECTGATLAGDVAALLDHLELARASVFGFSMGGGVGLQFAADYPDRIDRIVVGGVGDSGVNGLHDSVEVAAIADAFEVGTAPLGDGTPARLRRIAEAAGNDLSALVPFLRGGGWPGGLAELRPPPAPLLVLVAGGDQYMRSTVELRRLLPSAEFFEARDCDHHDLLDHEAVRARDRVLALSLGLRH